ncbi:probable serine/threonine-protein kinase DDB_G0281745 isoform X2 [Patiria miniata]|nr:probable serine/threonine-protein kinase DDB_G0281745 isoform X2 [Patiria miniata]
MDINMVLRGQEETCVDCGLPVGLLVQPSTSDTCVDCGFSSARCPHWSCQTSLCPKPGPSKQRTRGSGGLASTPSNTPPLPPLRWLGGVNANPASPPAPIESVPSTPTPTPSMALAASGQLASAIAPSALPNPTHPPVPRSPTPPLQNQPPQQCQTQLPSAPTTQPLTDQQQQQIIQEAMAKFQLSLPSLALQALLPPLDTAVRTVDPYDLELPPCGQVILGSGAFGTVRLEIMNGTAVAVKYVGVADRFPAEREARAMSLLSGHPSFPILHGIVADSQKRGLVMEFIGDHHTLKSLTLNFALEGSHRLKLAPQAWSTVALDVLDGLRCMHDSGLLHNDLKTDNILLRNVRGTWRACIIDVGLCTLAIHPRVYHMTEAQKAQCRQYHAHLAPELVEDAAPQTQLSDIFQLGLVLHSIGHWCGVPVLARLGEWCVKRDPQQRPSTAVIRLILMGIR